MTIIRQPLQILLMALQKLEFLVSPPPILIKPSCLSLIQIVVVVGDLFSLVASLLPDDLPALVVEHPLLCYFAHPVVVFVGLLLLGDGLSVFVLACAVLEVTVVFQFAVGTHRGGADVGLAYV